VDPTFFDHVDPMQTATPNRSFLTRWIQRFLTAPIRRGSPTADPLVAPLSAADALRFGRRTLQPTELDNAFTSIEASLRSAP